MQSVHHVVMATYKRLINSGRLQYREFEGSFQVLPTDPVGNKDHIATGEAHRKRASRDVVGTQVPGGELHVKVADCLFLVLVTGSSANGVDLVFHVGTIIQVHHRQAEVGSFNHGSFIESLQENDERIVGHGISLRHDPPGE